MESQPKCTEFTPALGQIPAFLVAAFLAALSAGCAPSTPPPKITEPITIELTHEGDVIKVTDANGIPLPKQVHISGTERHYLFGRGKMINPSNPSVPIQANCVWEAQELKEAKCWPIDRPVSLQLDKQGQIRSAYYLSQENKRVDAGRPVGAAPIAVKEYSVFCWPDGTGFCWCCSFGICYYLPCP